MGAPAAPLIPAAAGLVAIFDEFGIDTRPVVAYDADGDALVPTADGRLEVARLCRGFTHVSSSDSYHTAPLQLIPGGGWQLTQHPHPRTDATEPVTETVIAWALCVDGAVRPVIDGGDCVEVREFDDDAPFTLSHPGGGCQTCEVAEKATIATELNLLRQRTSPPDV